jgi:sortase A
MSPPSARQLLALTLVVAGAVLFGGFLADLGLGILHQQQLDRTWRQTIAAHPPPTQPADPIQTPAAVDGVDFAIRVPKLGYYAAVAEGIGADVLINGPGHYPATPWPGQPGNVGVAAHNTYWIKFGDLHAGDEIDLETRYGAYKYLVTGTKIVPADDRTVLAPTAGKQLTLTTCWPLWAGAFAQQRLAIFALQVFPKQATPSQAA